MKPSSRTLLPLVLLAPFGAAQSTSPIGMGSTLVGAAPPSANSTTALTALPPAANDCSAPTPISGTGIFLANPGSPTTGAQPPGCATPTTDIARDVWFTWSAPASGTVALSFSGVEPPDRDTKVAVFDGSACPTAAPLACDDNALGTLSEVRWTAVAGQSYVFQIGAPLGYTGQLGQIFTLGYLAPNDECNSALPIAGGGPFAFDTLSATASSQGQLVGTCGYPTQAGVERDLWFQWTAPTGSYGGAHLAARFATQTPLKFAVYPSASCPISAPIACSDFSCNNLATLDWTAVGGVTYLIEVGIPARSAFGVLDASSFTIAFPTAPPYCVDADGTSETAFGLVAGGTTGWFRALGHAGENSTVGGLYVSWGSVALPGLGPPNGTLGHALVWEDPNDDGDPSDAVLIADVTTPIAFVDTDGLQFVDFGTLVPVQGAFFVGAAVSHAAGARPAGWDTCTSGPQSDCWIFGQIGGAANFASLAANNVAPIRMSTLNVPGSFLLGACTTPAPPGSVSCTGDGLDPFVSTPCPCGNFGAPGHGCGHSQNLAGARLEADGLVWQDSVVLHGSAMPSTSTAVYLKGNFNILAGSTFGDGVLCAGGTLIRLRGKTNVGGASSFPDSAETITLSARGGNTVGSGQLAFYAVYYRNAAAYCTPATWNVSNGYTITW